MAVTRYNHYITYDDIPHMEEHTNGEYVKYVDYLRLIQELRFVKGQRDAIGRIIQVQQEELKKSQEKESVDWATGWDDSNREGLC